MAGFPQFQEMGMTSNSSDFSQKKERKKSLDCGIYRCFVDRCNQCNIHTPYKCDYNYASTQWISLCALQ